MIINIDTSEAVNFKLNGSDLTVLGTIRELLRQNQGYTEQSGKFKFKWLSARLIFTHLQTAAFKTARQLNNIINKLIRAGLLLKKMFFGKPYFCDLREQSQNRQPVQSAAVVGGSSAPAAAVRPSLQDGAPSAKSVKYSKNPVPTAEEITDYTTRQGWQGFDVAKFIEYNAARNWSGDWKEHAARWYDLQKKFKQKPLTYKELCTLIASHKVQQSDYQLNKVDGLWYKIPKLTPRPPVQSAAVVGGSSAPAAAVPPSLEDGAPSAGVDLTPEEERAAILELRQRLGIDNKKAEAATSASSFKVINMFAPINNDKHLKL